MRSMAKPVPVLLEGALGDGATATIRFAEPEYGVAPGQAAVLYAGERLEAGNVVEVQDRPGHPYTRMLLGCEVSMDTERDPVPRNNLFKVITGELPVPRRRPPGWIFEARCASARARSIARRADAEKSRFNSGPGLSI